MTFGTTLIFYLVIGASVAAAVYLGGDHRPVRERLARLLTAVAFWPLYLPLLLERKSAEASRGRTNPAPAEPADSLAQAIAQVESELDSALGSLDGWAEGVLADEHERLHELRAAWRAQANRIRELDRLLSGPEFVVPEPATESASGSIPPTIDRRFQSDRARTQNLRRLHELRQRMLDDLLGTLAWVRELVTMIHLAKFSGAPASRAEELVSQIAAAVEGLREASAWEDVEGEESRAPRDVSQPA
jgi:hypothetical protein